MSRGFFNRMDLHEQLAKDTDERSARLEAELRDERTRSEARADALIERLCNLEERVWQIEEALRAKEGGD